MGRGGEGPGGAADCSHLEREWGGCLLPLLPSPRAVIHHHSPPSAHPTRIKGRGSSCPNLEPWPRTSQARWGHLLLPRHTQAPCPNIHTQCPPWTRVYTLLVAGSISPQWPTPSHTQRPQDRLAHTPHTMELLMSIHMLRNTRSTPSHADTHGYREIGTNTRVHHETRAH